MVSIIIPTYNRAYILWRALNSILKQTYSDFEILVIDDHSTDETKNYKRLFTDKRIRFITSDSIRSVSGARNTGLKCAKGDLIAYLDSDNIVYSDWLETMVYYVKKYPKKLVFFPGQNISTEEINDDGIVEEVYKQQIRSGKDISEKNIWAHDFECDPNGMIHRRDILEANIKWDKKLKSYEDYDFILQILEVFEKSVFFIDKVLVNYQRMYGTDGLCSQNTYQLIVEQLEYIKGKYSKNPNWKKYSKIDDKIEKYMELYNYGYSPLEYIRERYKKKNK
jgi:glycosyltransferase involved in cell wall biosynthesis